MPAARKGATTMQYSSKPQKLLTTRTVYLHASGVPRSWGRHVLLGTRTTGAGTRHRCCRMGGPLARVAAAPQPSPPRPQSSRLTLPNTSTIAIHQHPFCHRYLPSFHQVSLIARQHEDGDGPRGLGRLRHRRHAPHAAQEGASVGAACKSPPGPPPCNPWMMF